MIEFLALEIVVVVDAFLLPLILVISSKAFDIFLTRQGSSIIFRLSLIRMLLKSTKII